MCLSCHFFNGTSAHNGLALNIPSYQSMFDSAPGTSSPLAAITNFNIQVAGENLFQQNFQYDFQTFINETSSLNAINGGASTSLTNGLIGHLEFENGYRYYVGNTSRRIESENSVPKSIVVQGQNNTSKAMDYICFIVFKRKITIDMKSGEIIENKV